MTRLLTRASVAGLSAALLAGAALVAVPASATEAVSLGWLRISPSAGSLDDPIDVLAEGGCPQGESLVVKVSGPGVPASASVGNIVGNTALSAVSTTEAGQLYVPLQVPLRMWFARNTPGLSPQGRYSLTLVCRDRVRSSQSFGAFTGQVDIKADGTYRAVGEAGRAFTTGRASESLWPQDPSDTRSPDPQGPSEGDSPAEPSGPAASASAPATPAAPGDDGNGMSSTPGGPSPAAEGQTPIDGGAGSTSGAEVAAPATLPATQQRAQGSGARWAIIALAAIALATGLLVAHRRRSTAPKGGASTTDPL